MLVVDPDGAACKMAAMRFPGRVGGDQERIRILSTLESLCELKKIAPSRLEIRTIDYLLEYEAFLLDPETPEGAAYLQRYTFKTLGGARKPKLIYRRRDGRWCDLVCAEIRALWEMRYLGIVMTTSQTNESRLTSASADRFALLRSLRGRLMRVSLGGAEFHQFQTDKMRNET